jgi:hypothetical protein
MRELGLWHYSIAERRGTEEIRRRLWRKIYERFNAKEVG